MGKEGRGKGVIGTEWAHLNRELEGEQLEESGWRVTVLLISVLQGDVFSHSSVCL